MSYNDQHQPVGSATPAPLEHEPATTMPASGRTYRVEVAGQFDRPVGALRQALLDAQPDHHLSLAAFTVDGTFTYAPSLTRFMFRYLIEATEESAVDADALALLVAEMRSQDYLAARGIPVKGTRTTATCLEDVKVRRANSMRSPGTA